MAVWSGIQSPIIGIRNREETLKTPESMATRNEGNKAWQASSIGPDHSPEGAECFGDPARSGWLVSDSVQPAEHDENYANYAINHLLPIEVTVEADL
jgi:hypothetical protein